MSSLPYLIAVNLLDYWILILTLQYVCAAHMELDRRNAVICSCTSALGTVFAFFCPIPLESIVFMMAAIILSVCLFSRRRLSDLLRFFPAFGIYFFLDTVPIALVEELVSPSNIQPVVQDDSRTLFSFAVDGTLLILLVILRHVQIKYRMRVHLS